MDLLTVHHEEIIYILSISTNKKKWKREILFSKYLHQKPEFMNFNLIDCWLELLSILSASAPMLLAITHLPPPLHLSPPILWSHYKYGHQQTNNTVRSWLDSHQQCNWLPSIVCRQIFHFILMMRGSRGLITASGKICFNEPTSPSAQRICNILLH